MEKLMSATIHGYFRALWVSKRWYYICRSSWLRRCNLRWMVPDVRRPILAFIAKGQTVQAK
jgi:hypothetical protein